MSSYAWLCLFLGLFLFAINALAAQESDVRKKAAELEAELRKTVDSSPAGATALLALIDHYHTHGQVFGLIDMAKRFTLAHADHPRHKDAMLKLLDGQMATSRHTDLRATARQFLERYGDTPEATDVGRRLARSFGRTNRRRDAADAYREVWRRLGARGLSEAVRAIQLYRELDSIDSRKQGSALADQLIDQLPEGSSAAAEVAWQGFHLARRHNDPAKSNSIGAKVIRRKLPLNKRRLYELYFAMGENDRSLGQHTNALANFRKARDIEDTPRVRHEEIRSLYAMNVKPEELNAPITDFLKKFPKAPNRFEVFATLAYAYNRAGNNQKAIEMAGRILPYEVQSHGLNQRIAEWTGDKPDALGRTEKILQAAISKNPPEAWRLRWILAFEITRDSLKDIPKAKKLARELVFEAPGNDSGMKDALRWLLENAEDEDEFKADVKRFLASARNFVHYENYRSILGHWAHDNRGNKKIQARVKHAKSEFEKFQNGTFIKQWRQGEGEKGKGREARDWLLKQDGLTKAQRKLVLTRQGESYRGGHEKQRSKAIPYYRKAARLFPSDYDAARRWLSSAQGYGSNEEGKAAAEHFLKIPAPENDHYVWRELLGVAEKNKDAALAKKALAWINDSQERFGIRMDNAGDIGDSLLRLGLKNEAIGYWRAHAEGDRNNWESQNCTRKILRAMRSEKEKNNPLTGAQLDVIREMAGPESDQHGAFAFWLADQAFKKGDWEKFETLLRDARKRQDGRPFRGWGAGEWPAQGWVDHAQKSDEMSAERKKRIYEVVRDMTLGRTSAAARLALLAQGRSGDTMSRLLAYHDATMEADAGSHGWDRLWPYAQRALARKENAEAAALLTGMLENITQVRNDRREPARALIRKAYGNMGALGFDVDSDSPLAPLLQIGLHQRLGENDLAVASYKAHRRLFDEHRDQLPIEILLFAAETHINEGGEENHDRAEDILRTWMINNGENEKTPREHKAAVQLLLAKNFQKAGRWEVARMEFVTVTNAFPNTDESTEAKFGIGETFMEQKIYDQAEEIFLALAQDRDPKIMIRAEFLRGVLANRREDRDEARRIFREVLERMPDVHLANQALYNLAEVYGYEQRFLEQLELLRTVGRLGRESKQWHEPGRALSVVVHDVDLGISRGHGSIPVVVRTEPGGDEETASLKSGGAGKGLFISELETVLGGVEVGDGVLQVRGSDVITVDYPEDFKAQFRFDLLANHQIRIASDGRFRMASARIQDEGDESFTRRLAREAEEAEADQRKSIQRPASEVKPGNLVYLWVRDHDRNLTDDPDEVPVKLVASSGDTVQGNLTETGPHTGVFEGVIETGELPAGALASDNAIGQTPLMAIDKDPATAWVSEPDGQTPKWLAVDMKDLEKVDRIRVSTPNAEKQAPVRFAIQGSHDGRFWYRLGEFPEREADPVPAENFGKMTQRVWKVNPDRLAQWPQIVDFVKRNQPLSEQSVDTLEWNREPPAEGEEQRDDSAYGVLWHGKFVQQRSGAVRFSVSGGGAVMLNGKLELPPGQEEPTVDVMLPRGLHDLAIWSVVPSGTQGASATRARENPNVASVTAYPFSMADFDTEAPEAKELAAIKVDSGSGKVTAGEGNWELSIPETELRYVKLIVNEYVGEALAINQVEIAGGETQHIPTEADLIALATNNVLEIAAGDTVTGSYVDQFVAGIGLQNRVLSQRLTATYYNGLINPITYGFSRSGSGIVNQSRRELLRIDPAERIVIEVVDFDLDSTGQEDSVPVTVQVNEKDPIELTATETGTNTGIFRTQIDTAMAKEEGKIAVKPGDRIYLKYLDEQNTFPGHAYRREGVVLVRTPSDGRIRIVESRATPVPEGSNTRPTYAFVAPSDDDTPDAIRGVCYELPLTVEVIDPDAAKDSASTVVVNLQTEDGSPMRVECRISSAFAAEDGQFAEARNPALWRGRFIGQTVMRLGGPGSPREIPVTEGMPRGLIGRVLPPEKAAEEGENETGPEPRPGGGDLLVSVFNITGKDVVTARYTDIDRTDGFSQDLNDRGRLISDGHVMITDNAYEEPPEILFLGERLYVRLEDPDLDVSDERDKGMVTITTTHGESETVALEETLSHSGVFTGSFALGAEAKPTKGNHDSANPAIEGFFKETLTASYADKEAASGDGHVSTSEAPIAEGTDGLVAAFSKVFGDEELAVQTQFHVAESYFELFKSHLKIDRKVEAERDLRAGRRVLKELAEDYPDPKYAPRIAYLAGQFSQEMKDWSEAIVQYKTIVSDYPEHALAADAQYKLGHCYEESGDFDNALESYVTLAASYPKSPLIANTMLRINEYFYKGEEFEIAAQVGKKFLERFSNHEWAARMAFRVGQCFYKQEEFVKGGEAFDEFVKKFPDDDLTAQGLFWAGESYRMANNVPFAFRRYNRCRWDFPESDAAKYARGRLALPEMLAQFEREANIEEEE